MKNICIMGFGVTTNYGTDLMHLAVQRTLANYGVRGHLVFRLAYNRLSDKAFLRKINPKGTRSSNPLLDHLYEWIYEYDMTKRFFKKRLQFLKFEKKYIRKTRYCYTLEEIEEEIQRLGCRAIMVESDCLWHPLYLNELNTLGVGSPQLYRFSYAPSLFVSELSEKQKDLVRSFSNNFKNIDKISVREKSGSSLLAELTGVESSVVVDPVMLLTKKQWKRYMAKPLLSEEYAFCYILEDNPMGNKRTLEIAQKLGIKTIAYLRTERKSEIKYGDTCGIQSVLLNDIGPSEFLRLIYDAKYIFTDSFHAMNFCIIFNKIFFSFERQNKYWQPDARICHLLNEYGLLKQIVNPGDAITDQYLQEKEIEYEVVNQKLLANRRRSLQFIEDAIHEF